MAQKLWRVSRILEKSPFEESVLSLSVPQMDWIMSMYAADNPKAFKFIPASEIGKEGLSMDLNIQWAAALMGKARDLFMNRMRPKRRAPVMREDPGIREFPETPDAKH